MSWNSSQLSTLAHICHIRFVIVICVYLNYLFCFLLLQIFCEVTKQVSNYSLQYFNHSHFPIPQTCIVVLCELVKLVTTFIRAKCKFLIASLGFAVMRKHISTAVQKSRKEKDFNSFSIIFYYIIRLIISAPHI